MRWLVGTVLMSVAVLCTDMVKPIPLKIDVDWQKAALGKKLFNDPILSRDNTVSCASCHDLSQGGDDGMPASVGIGGAIGSINSPTVYNAVFNFRQFWDGRAKDLANQVYWSVENPKEMGEKMTHVVEKLKHHQWYKRRFEQLYEDGVTTANISNAIAIYETTLITPNAPFDRYLRGDENAISKQAKEGYRLFKYKGCVICHNGVNIGGNLFGKFGIYDDPKSRDLGRYHVTHKETDKYVFKVPTLRNISKTAPYLHDGRTNSLAETVKLMTQLQLGRFMSDEEIEAIVAFLESLDGEIPASAKRDAQ